MLNLTLKVLAICFAFTFGLLMGSITYLDDLGKDEDEEEE